MELVTLHSCSVVNRSLICCISGGQKFMARTYNYVDAVLCSVCHYQRQIHRLLSLCTAVTKHIILYHESGYLSLSVSLSCRDRCQSVTVLIAVKKRLNIVHHIIGDILVIFLDKMLWQSSTCSRLLNAVASQFVTNTLPCLRTDTDVHMEHSECT